MLKQKNTVNKAIKLSPDQAYEVLRVIPDTMLQGRRMFEYLTQSPETPTGILCSKCSIGNLSDIAHYVNPHIYRYKLMIGCDKPEQALVNKFGDTTNQFLWSIYEIDTGNDTGMVLPEAANDGDYKSPADSMGINKQE